MSFSELERRRIEQILSRFCEARVSTATGNRPRLEYAVGDDWVNVSGPRRGAGPAGLWTRAELLQLRFDVHTQTWSLYVPGGEGGWERYAPVVPSTNLEDLLEAVGGAPSAIFWD